MKYRLYGLVLETDFPVRNRLLRAESDAKVDLTFEVLDDPPTFETIPPLGRFVSHRLRADGQPVFSVEEHAERTVLSFPENVRYHLVGGSSILVERVGNVSDELIEVHLLGLVASLVLERKGVLALNASAVVRPSGAIGFLAFNQGGRTSLAASFVQAGDPLLTDDVLAIRSNADVPTAAPGHPQMQMWPEQAAAFLGGSDRFARVLPTASKRLIPVDEIGSGGFCTNAQPIAGLFVPERVDERTPEIVIERMPPSDAFRTILSNGFISEIAEAPGLLRSRFASITHLVGVTPVFRLQYPTGIHHLPDVRRAILRRIESDYA